MKKMRLANFIGGEYRAPLNEKYFDNFNPATGEAYSEIPDSGAEDIAIAVAAAKAAFPAWSAMPARERSQILERAASILEKRTEEFARAESMDQGKTYLQALTIEVPRAVLNLRFFATAVLHEDIQAFDMDGQAMNLALRSPIGVAALISPWNLPLHLLTWKIGPALATGNTAVCKPSEMTSMTAYMLGKVFQEAGLPTGVCNIVLGLGGTAGDALIRHPDVKLVSFTGGTATGTHIARSTAGTLKRLSLELGGKNPGVIFSDADLEECIPTTLRSSFQNQGEICLCNSRLYVEESIFEKFVDRLVAATKKIRAGDPMSADSFLGAVISRAHQEKILSYIEIARSEGANILCGGGVPKLPAPFDKGFFVEPTIITGVAQGSRVQQEEIFGPVVTITPFKSEAEAISLANDSKYGLAATVWTRDSSRAQRMARAMDAGTVWVNTWMLRDLRVPFGGMKQSGVGREGGKYSIDFFTELKNICIKTEAE